MHPRIKICCIASVDEAQTAIKFGADALGLVARMPSGPGPIPDDKIMEIAQAVPPPVSTFMLTSETSPEAIVQYHHRTLTTTIQLVDEVENGTYAFLRKQIPNVKIVQVIHVANEASIEEALRLSEQVDALRNDHAIYAVRDGRINVAGISESNCETLCRAIAAVQ